MQPLKIIKKYYTPNSENYKFLIKHSEAVAKKSIKTAKTVKHFNPDIKFIKEAAILHDIAIFLTIAPEIGCMGKKHYVCHGYLGRKLLEKEGLPKHGLVSERHIGVGLTKQDIIRLKFPLPKRDMFPISIEEKIITFADKFFSKNEEYLTKEKSVDYIKEGLSKFGSDKVKIFEEWLELFR